ncbi:MAG: uroporphyrinogen decarboxylase family protein, partial [Candidatus Neomarinimicrobiota bacterium]
EVEAWSQVDIEVFISHDDLAMTKGPIFRPDWFREHIFPHYPQIWKPLKDKGIKVIFCSDGNYGPLIDDIAAAGADGFIIEPSVDLQTVVGKYGGRKAIIGNVDTKVLTFEGEKEIEAEVRRCVSTAGHHPGFFINAVGGIPHNIPLKNVEAYFAACRKYRSRKVTT